MERGAARINGAPCATRWLTPPARSLKFQPDAPQRVTVVKTYLWERMTGNDEDGL